MALRSLTGRGLCAISGSLLVIAITALATAQPASEPPKPPAPASTQQPATAPATAQPAKPAQPGEPGARRGPAGAGARPAEFTSVEAAMKAMRQGLRSLREIVDNPEKKEDALAAVALIQRGCLGSKSLKPEHLKKGITIDEYRRAQIQLMGMLLELETQILDGKTTEARASYEKLGKFRDDSHEKFGGEEDKPDQPGNTPATPTPPTKPESR